MTNTTNRRSNTMTTTTEIAEEALNVEGVSAYFPGLDPHTFDAVDVLADYLDEHPDQWSPAGDDYGWECTATTGDLVAHAIDRGAVRDDLTDQAVVEIFGGAATIDGDTVTVTLTDPVVTATDLANDPIERVVIDLRLMPQFRSVLWDQATELPDDEGWATAHLFLDSLSIEVGHAAVTIQGAAWAGDWVVDEDGDGDFVDERHGRDVTLVVPFSPQS